MAPPPWNCDGAGSRSAASRSPSRPTNNLLAASERPERRGQSDDEVPLQHHRHAGPRRLTRSRSSRFARRPRGAVALLDGNAGVVAAERKRSGVRPTATRFRARLRQQMDKIGADFFNCVKRSKDRTRRDTRADRSADPVGEQARGHHRPRSHGKNGSWLGTETSGPPGSRQPIRADLQDVAEEWRGNPQSSSARP